MRRSTVLSILPILAVLVTLLCLTLPLGAAESWKSLHVAGSFNAWNPAAETGRMNRNGDDWEAPASLQTKHMAGDCLDLATEWANVRQYLNDAICHWLDLGVDAIRLDTVKHVERGDLLSYVNTWKKHKPGLFVFGENLVKGHGWGDLGGNNGPSSIRPWWYTRLGDDPRNPNSGPDSWFSVLDFSLFSTFRDNLSHGCFNGIEGVLAMDWIYGDATRLVTFLQNHDVGPDNDFKYRFKGDDWMAAIAYNLLWTIRGIPCLYYGEEIRKGNPPSRQKKAPAGDTARTSARQPRRRPGRAPSELALSQAGTVRITRPSSARARFFPGRALAAFRSPSGP